MSGSSHPVELAVVVPTFNERANLTPFLHALKAALTGIPYEVIFVDDDSPDGTAADVRAIAREDSAVRPLQRIGRRGLSSACLEGMLATSAPCIAVMDADLQHDERILPAMLARLNAEQLDLVVATRNAEGGNMGDFAHERVRLSHAARRLSRLISHTSLTDPMSGFFVVSRGFFEEVVHHTSGIGFKVLLDLVASSRRPVRFAEIPYSFRARLHGSSKLDILVAAEYLFLLVDKTAGRFVPPRFLIFSLAGSAGYVLFVCTLYVLLHLLALPFMAAQAITTGIAMTVNFFLNNSLTYHDRRLRGRRLASGLATFYAACLIGVFANVRLAQFAREHGFPWYAAGGLGLLVGAVWNYGVTSTVTWRSRSFRKLQ
ncbi:MAG: glycosyltransferase family 2 protein [Acidobacteriota bacterium]